MAEEQGNMSIQDRIANDPELQAHVARRTAVEQTDSGGGDSSASSENIAGTPGVAGTHGTPGTQTTQAIQPFYEYGGIKFKLNVGPDGKVSAADLDKVLENPFKAASRHQQGIRDHQFAEEKVRVRQEEFGKLTGTIEQLINRLAAIEGGGAIQRPPAVERPATDEVDWSTVNVEDPRAVMAAMSKAVGNQNLSQVKALLENAFAPMQQVEQASAMKSLTEQYNAWKDYNLDAFKEAIEASGVEITENGVNWKKTPPHVLREITGQLGKRLSNSQQLDKFAGDAETKVIAGMPKRPDGKSLWNERLTTELRAGVREAILSGRPSDTQEDLDIITQEVGSEVWIQDVKYIVDRATEIHGAIEASRGAVQKIPAGNAEPPPEQNAHAGETSDERQKRITENMTRDLLAYRH